MLDTEGLMTCVVANATEDGVSPTAEDRELLERLRRVVRLPSRVDEGRRFVRWARKRSDRNDWVGGVAHRITQGEGFPVAGFGAMARWVWEQFNQFEQDGITCLLRVHELRGFVALAEEYLDAVGGPIGNDRRSLDPAMRFEVMRRDAFRCRLCGSTADEGVALEVDHKVPLARGGTNDSDNLWTLCSECNNGKGAKSLETA